MGRNEVDAVQRGRDDHVGDRDGLIDEQIVDRSPERGDIHADGHGQTGLRVQVDGQHPTAPFDQRRGDVHRARRLGGAALLIEERDNPGHQFLGNAGRRGAVMSSSSGTPRGYGQ